MAYTDSMAILLKENINYNTNAQNQAWFVADFKIICQLLLINIISVV